MRQKITKRLADTIKATGKLYEIRDSEVIGFGIRITPAGAKSYTYQWRDAAGVWRRETIGRHGTVTADMARATAQKWAGIVASGGDPCPKVAPPTTATMQALADRYMAEHAAYKKSRSALNDSGYWRNHILPAMGALRVAAVTRQQVEALHLSMRATPTNANRVLEVLRKGFNLAEVWGMRAADSNPCKGVKPFKLRPRRRYISASEAQRLGVAMRAMEREGGLVARFVALVRLNIYTGARKGEWLGARWDDVDIQRGILHLADSKSGEAQEIILPPAALDVLAGIGRVLGNPYIIAGAVRAKPLQETRRLWRRLCADAGIEGLRMHDLRHSFASYTVSATGNLAMVRGLLRHADPKTTMRYAHLLDDPLRAAAHAGAGALSALVDGPPPPDNIIAMKKPPPA